MNNPRHNTRTVRAPHGSEITAKQWTTEAPMRMLMNNLDPDVAENPHELVVYGGIGRAARTWNDFDTIVSALQNLSEDETLCVQSGKPVGVFKTHKDAPRVLIANSNIVPHWANWDHFNELDKKGLMMYGQMTAGSWIYIGSQGIVQGTYETFKEAGRQHYGGDLTGKWILTAGLGGMGGAQPLAAVLAGACCLAVECNEESIDFRLRTRYVDEKATSLDEALDMIARWTAAGEAKSVGLLGNAADIFPELAKRAKDDAKARPDIVTDQTSAHDVINGYLPQGWTVAEWRGKEGNVAKGRRNRGARLNKGSRSGHAGFLACRYSHAGLWKQYSAGRQRRGTGKRLRLSGFCPGLCAPPLLPRHWTVPLGGALRRS